MPSHGNVRTKHVPVYSQSLYRIAEGPELEWPAPIVPMPLLQILRSQDFEPFVLLCLALALPRGCMWLQAALVGVLRLLYLRSLDILFCAFYPVQSSRVTCRVLTTVQLSAFHIFNTVSNISIYVMRFHMGETMGNPWGR